MPESTNLIENLKSSQIQEAQFKKIKFQTESVNLENKPIMEIKNLYKSYGSFSVLKNLNFNICTQDIIGVIGVNGAGKTTLFKCLLGIVGYQGIIKINTNISKKQKIFNVLWVENGFDGDLTVQQNYKFYYDLYGVTYYRQDLIQLLKEFKIEHTLNKPFKFLSSGQKRKCAILRTFIKSAPLVLLDEPTSALDLVSQNHFSDFLTKKIQTQNSGCILITHNYKDLEDICNKLLILNNGEILEFDTIENITNTYLKGHLVKLWVLNNTENIKFIQKAIDLLKLQNYLVKNPDTCIFYIRLKLKKDYTSFQKLYESVKLFVLRQKSEKIKFSTLVDLILSNIIFK
jgi:ABC-2 type transport system ATP-binding protein